MTTKDLLDKLDLAFEKREKETDNYINYLVNGFVITVYLKGCYPEFAITDYHTENPILNNHSNMRFYTETVKDLGIGYDTIFITLYCGCKFEIVYRFN